MGVNLLFNKGNPHLSLPIKSSSALQIALLSEFTDYGVPLLINMKVSCVSNQVDLNKEGAKRSNL
jgi:hypothetical protein